MIYRFQSICKATYICVNRPTFWLNLYEKHAVISRKYFKGCDLPEHLSPDYVNHNSRQNLRIQVVRALFHCYNPLKERLISPNQILQDPHKVIGKICLSAWTAKRNSTYRFCFKLNTKKAHNFRAIFEDENQKDNNIADDWELIEDQSETMFQQAKIGRDPEEDNQMLFMDSNNFSLLPGSLGGL